MKAGPELFALNFLYGSQDLTAYDLARFEKHAESYLTDLLADLTNVSQDGDFWILLT